MASIVLLTGLAIVNKDSTVHDVIDAEGGIKSGDVKAGGTGSVKAPDKAGSYPFVCTYHPKMKGTLVVTRPSATARVMPSGDHFRGCRTAP